MTKFLSVFLTLFFSLCNPVEGQRYPPSGGGGCQTFVNQAALPGSATDGTCAVTLDTDTMWVFNLSGLQWLVVGTGGSTVTSVGAFGSTPNADGASIFSNVLTLEPADGTHPGGMSTTTQTLAGAKTFSGTLTGSSQILGANGSAGSPEFAFTNNTDSGMYRVGAGEIGIAVQGVEALDFIKSTGGGNFGNVGMGGSASVSDAYPLLMQRTLVGGPINVQLGNPDNTAGAGSKWQSVADNGANTTEISAFTAATFSPDAYAGGRGVFRCTGSETGCSIVADTASNSDVRVYAGGNASTNKMATFNSSGLTLNQSATSVTAPIFTSSSSTPATAGVFRLASGDGIDWRNNANSANVALAKDTSDNLTYNGTAFLSSTPRLLAAAFPALTGDVTTSGGSLGTTLAATSNTTLTSLANLATVGTIGTGTWHGTAVGTQWGGLGGDFHLSSGALSISSGTVSAGTLSTTNGGTGISNPTAHDLLIGAGSSALTQVAPVAGTVVVGTASISDPSFSATPTLGVAASTSGTLALASSTASTGLVTLANQGTTSGNAYTFSFPLTGGSNGFALTTNGSGTTTWTSVLTNPMTTLGDVIVGGSSGTPARLAVGTNGTVLTADSSATDGVSWQQGNYKNFLVNSAFDYWQAGTSTTITSTGGSTPTPVSAYESDQWYVTNKLGAGTTEGVITYSQQTGSNTGSIFGAQVKITTAPSGTGAASSYALSQPLSNLASLDLMAVTSATFAVKVKALGNINSVHVAVYYASSETKVNNSAGGGTQVGSQACTINTSTWTTCSINVNPTTATPASTGIFSVSIEAPGASTGNGYDLNNGFIVEQASLTIGPNAPVFHRQFGDAHSEITACQFFYEKSYDLATAPGTASTTIGAITSVAANATATIPFSFKTNKRNDPVMTFYSTVTGASGKFRNITGNTDVTATDAQTGQWGSTMSGTVSDTSQVEFHFTADSRI